MYSVKHLYTKLKRTHLPIVTLSTKHSIHIRVEIFFDGLTIGFTKKIKYKGGHHRLLRVMRCRYGLDLKQVEKLKSVKTSTYQRRVNINTKGLPTKTRVKIHKQPVSIY